MQRANNDINFLGTNKTQAINVLMYVNDGKNDIAFDLNQEGLYRMSFDRYSDEVDSSSGILTSMDVTLFDSTGSQLLPKLQQNNFRLVMQYGYEGNLSPKYSLNVLKVVSNFGREGVMVSVGAIGEQINQQWPAELYKQGVRVDSILKVMADRNDWYYSESNIDCDIVLDRELLKESDETDIDFIKNKLRPLVTKAVVPESIKANETVFWEIKLIDVGLQYELHFRPSNSRSLTRRKWTYTYGTAEPSSIIELKSTVDQTYLLNGMTIQVSSDEVEASAMGDNETAQDYLNTKIADLSKEISEVFRVYNIPMMAPDNFRFKVELINAENLGNKTLDQRILEAIEKAVSIVNTAEMTILGNPNIRATDLVELIVKNRDGTINVLTSPTNINSYWKVIGIKETIGVDGYNTHLTLVRDIVNI